VKPRLAPPQLKPKGPERQRPKGAARSAEKKPDMPVQTKLNVGPTNDYFETEADRVAAHIVSGSYGPPPAISSLGNAAPGAALRKTKPKEEIQAQAAGRAAELQRKTEQTAEPDKKAVQSAKAVQRKTAKPESANPDKKLQRKLASTSKEPETPAAGGKKKPPIQRAAIVPSPERTEEQLAQLEPAGAVSAAGGPAPASVEAGIGRARQGGQPIAAPVLEPMERGFGRDFSAVRVHADGAAGGLNGALGARAFTTGSDIFFASGEYRPETGAGRRLLAHELTHVVQQSDGRGVAQPLRIQRAGPESQKDKEEATKPAEPPKVWTDPKVKDRSIDLSGEMPVYKLPALDLPKMLGTAKGDSANATIAGQHGEGFSAIVTNAPFVWTGKGTRKAEQKAEQKGNPDAQVAIWREAIEGKGTLLGLIDKTFGKQGEDFVKEKVHYLQLGKAKRARGAPLLFVGTAAELAVHNQITTPKWDQQGKYADMEVDHFHEIQLGGRHHISNFWLLEKKKNAASGPTIMAQFLGPLNKLTDDAAKTGFFDGPNAGMKLEKLESYPQNVRVEFAKVTAKRDFGVEELHWTARQVEEGEHLDELKPLTAEEMKDEGLDPKATLKTVNLFLGKDSAYRRRMEVKGTELEPVDRVKQKFVSGFDLRFSEYIKPTVVADDQPLGKLVGYAFGNRTVEATLPGGEKQKVKLFVSKMIAMPILSQTKFGYGGYLDRSVIDEALKKQAEFKISGASPITIQDAGIRGDFELFAQGLIGPTKPLIAGMQIPIRMEGDAVFIDYPLPAEGLGFGPFKIIQSSLQLGVNEKGLFFGGMADFVIEGVGIGHVEARNLDLLGKFKFDFEAFNPAEVEVAYKNDAWSIAAKLGVKQGILPGVKSGDVEVTANSETFGVVGTVVIGAPGIPERTTITVGYTPDKGLVIGGEVPLATDRIPGVTDAKMSVLIRRNPETKEWSVFGAGTANFALTGVKGSLTISWRDGILSIGGLGTIQRDPMTGSVSFLVTNQPVDEEGKPIDGPPLAEFRASGSGSVSIKFGKLLTGTAGITVMENGEIEIIGKIGLPPSIEIVPQEVIKLPGGVDFPEVRFPIIGLTVPVINKSFGVFGFIRGGVTVSATFGPGFLKDTAVDVKYNPDHPEQARIHGGSRFEITAMGGVAVTVTGGIGAGLAIVEATGEVGIKAGLGVELRGAAKLGIDWTPVQGLSVDASVKGEAKPKFSIDLLANAAVVADLGWFGEYDIWTECWDKNLGSFGPDLAVKGYLPASWSERDGLNLDLAKADIDYPDISIKDLAISVFEAVV
jgi:hypothetical protein